MLPSKWCDADEAVAAIADGTTLGITGAGGGLLEPEALLAAIERRFLATGHPRDLTLVHAQGLGDGAGGGLNHLAHEGLVRRVIGAHWTWSPRMQALAAAEAIEAYALPGGVIQHLVRETGAGRPGLVTRIGLDSFVDPRREGGRMNRRAIAPLVEHLVVGGRDHLLYRPLPIDVAIVRGTSADARGNVGFEGEGAELDALVLAMAAHNNRGRTLAQVRHAAQPGARQAERVRLPGALVDAVVLDAGQRWSHAGDPDEMAIPKVAAAAGAERQVIAARAALELAPGAVVSFGFGIPDGIAALARARGELDRYHPTLDHGHHGGSSLQGALFGFVPDGEARIDSPTQFDFYSGGGIDLAMLGFGEADAAGNVNVSRLGGKIIGPGGFIDIAQPAGAVVFCGVFETRGFNADIVDGALRILAPGAVPKLVGSVEQVTFSGRLARETGQRVLFVTERAVFRLLPEGMVLEEIAPGVDLDRDVLARMGFAPLLPPAGPGLMPATCFA